MTTHEEKKKRIKKLRGIQWLMSAAGVIIIAWGLWEVACLFMDYRWKETTNDAQIEQYLSPVNLRASGYIKKIYFTEHQHVKKGDTLLILDDREYKIRVMEAEAALKDAMAGANVIGATIDRTQTTASVYDASISEIEVRIDTSLTPDTAAFRWRSVASKRFCKACNSVSICSSWMGATAFRSTRLA